MNIKNIKTRIISFLGFIIFFIIFLSESSFYVKAGLLGAENSLSGMIKRRYVNSITKGDNVYMKRDPSLLHRSLQERADPKTSIDTPTSVVIAIETQNASNSVPTQSNQSVQTEPKSMSTIIALISCGGVVVIIAIIFAFVRKRRYKKMTDNTVIPSTVSWEQQNNEYKKTEDNEPQSLKSCVVIATYTPTYVDELNIQLGDKVIILAEYDDGWIRGINETRGGAEGVFPKNCVDMNSNLNINKKRSSSTGGVDHPINRLNN